AASDSAPASSHSAPSGFGPQLPPQLAMGPQLPPQLSIGPHGPPSAHSEGKVDASSDAPAPPAADAMVARLLGQDVSVPQAHARFTLMRTQLAAMIAGGRY